MKNDETLREGLIRRVQEWDQMIRDGQSLLVLRMCRKLNHKLIPRDLLLDFAQIARRIGAPDLIVFWYASIIRETRALSEKPTVAENAIYALALSRLGAFREAGEILNRLSPSDDPQIHFYRGSLYTSQWQYRKATIEWKKYLKDSRLSEYSKLVGHLNFCAGLVSLNRFKVAEQEISKLLKKLEKGQHWLLKGNLHEIIAQLRLQQDQWDRAIHELNQASQYLKNADSRTKIYVDKWRCILELQKGNNNQAAISKLQEIKLRAEANQDWETVRDCDFQVATRTRNVDLLLRVYWGTIFPDYKSRALKQFGWSEKKLKEYIWTTHIKPEGLPQVVKRIDLVKEAPTLLLSRLFFALTREFYRPLRHTEIFELIYENEFYHPIAGVIKLKRLINRARQWLIEMNYPIAILPFRNGNKLEIHPSVELIIQKDFILNRQLQIPIKLSDSEYFTTSDWAREQKVSARSAVRQLSCLVKEKKIEMQYHGCKTFYKKIA